MGSENDAVLRSCSRIGFCPRSAALVITLGAWMAGAAAFASDLPSQKPSNKQVHVDARGKPYQSKHPPMRFLPAFPSDQTQGGISEDCIVKIVLEADLDSTYQFPCDALFVPPQGRGVTWIESGSKISDRLLLVNMNPVPGDVLRSTKLVFPPLVQGGVVRVGNTNSWERDDQARLIHTTVHQHAGGVLDREFWKRASRDEVGDGVLMPAGEVIAAVFDPHEQRYRAVSRPIEVTPGENSVATVARPNEGTADLIVQVDRVVMRSDWRDADIDVVLRTPTQRIPPELTVSSLGRVHLFWWALEPTHAEILVSDEAGWAAPRPISLRPGRVESEEVSLAKKPDLSVSIAIPMEVFEDEIQVEIRDVTGDDLLRSLEISESVTTVAFKRLPPKRLLVRVVSATWVFEEQADMRSGNDQLITLSPPTISVSGRVTFCGEPALARVGFVSLRTTLGEEPVIRETISNEGGVYELFLVEGQVSPDVRIRTMERDPREHRDVVLERLTDGMVIDWDLPCSRITARVVNAETGDPLVGARVVAIPEDDAARSLRAVTDELGTAVLDPISEGRASVFARAAGFGDSSGQHVMVVEQGKHEVEIALTRNTGNIIEVRLPNGQPAAGAEVAVFVDLGSGPVWRGQCDEDGKLKVPDQPEGLWIAGRHSAAGFALARLNRGVSNIEVALSLSAPAPATSFRFVDPSGEPVGSAAVVLWINGTRISNDALGWLVRSPSSAMANGMWRPRYPLPLASIEILAWHSIDTALRAAFNDGEYDFLRQPIAAGLGSVIELEVPEP